MKRLSLLLALAVALMAALPALAHAELVSTEPAAGATVPAGLRELRLTFNEPLAAGSQVVVYTGQFDPVVGMSSGMQGAVLHVVFTSALREGVYTVQWTAVGSDGHPVEGSYQFAVSPAGGSGQGPRIIFIATIVSGMVGLAAVVVLSLWRRRTGARRNA